MLHQRYRNQLSSCLRFSDVPHGAMLLLWNEAQDKKEGRETRKHTIKQLHGLVMHTPVSTTRVIPRGGVCTYASS